MINYITLADKSIAARRYRMDMIGEYIGNYKVTKFPIKADVYVMTKPYITHELLLETYRLRAKTLDYVFDISDDLFNRDVSGYIKDLVKMARVVTVPTEAMRNLVIEQTGVDAVVIPDHYEFEEKPIKDITEKKFLWYGHESNLKYLKGFKHQIEIVTHDNEYVRSFIKDLKCTFTKYSKENLQKAFDRNNIVYIPSDDSRKNSVKSENRVVEAVRQGLSVVAYPLPSYEKFNISSDIEDVKQTTPELQKYVRDNFDISVIGEKWKQLFKSLSGSTLDAVEGF